MRGIGIGITDVGGAVDSTPGGEISVLTDDDEVAGLLDDDGVTFLRDD